MIANCRSILEGELVRKALIKNRRTKNVKGGEQRFYEREL